MSRIIINIILLMTMGFSGCRFPVCETDDMDGGVKTYNRGVNLLKVVESTEIVSFNCGFSLLAAVFMLAGMINC